MDKTKHPQVLADLKGPHKHSSNKSEGVKAMALTNFTAIKNKKKAKSSIPTTGQTLKGRIDVEPKCIK